MCKSVVEYDKSLSLIIHNHGKLSWVRFTNFLHFWEENVEILNIDMS